MDFPLCDFVGHPWYGKLTFTVCEQENGPVELVDLPMKNGDFPWLC